MEPGFPFPSPFDAEGPHPVARQAAESLVRALRARPELTRSLYGDQGGKMFGVLVATGADGSARVLWAFSGLLEGQWDAEGFVGPVFDKAARAQVEVAGEAEVKRLTARYAALAAAPELLAARAQLAELAARQAQARDDLKARHRVAKQARAAQRAAGAPAAPLDQQSRQAKAELRWLLTEQEAQRAPVARAAARLERRLGASERLRAWFSRRLMRSLHDTYLLPNARGEVRPLRALFAGEPPSGAADCAAPKLLAAAFREGHRPVAMAEFWWGAPPATGNRVEGEFAPACRLKCGPVLPFMLEGLEVAPPRGLGAAAAADAPLRVLYEDTRVVLVEKPPGLLSVPGRGAHLRDSALTRLRARWPSARLVHRLDLDTSGVLLAALDDGAYRALQRQFAARTVEKRYVAVLEGLPAGESGTIALPLRVDLEDRPRQLVDPVHGRAAVTEWKLLERGEGRSRVAFSPRTGRTHQLRVHASHPLGLGAPIVGDRLYGRAGPRLMLHAEALGFVHPGTGAPVRVESPAPF